MLIDAKRQRKGRHLFDPDLDPRISQHVAKVRDDGAISIEATVETRNNSSIITFSAVSSMAGQPGSNRFHDGLNDQKKPSFSFSILDTQPSPKPKKRKRTKFFSRGRPTTGPLLESNANVHPTAAIQLVRLEKEVARIFPEAYSQTFLLGAMAQGQNNNPCFLCRFSILLSPFFP